MLGRVCATGCGAWAVGALLALATLAAATAAEIAPLKFEAAGGREVGVYAERSLAVGVSIDAERAELVGLAGKARPFRDAVLRPAARSVGVAEPIQVELVLFGPGEDRFTRRVELRGLCLAHPPGAEPHVAGDTIHVHHDSFVVELPDLPGFRMLEVAYYRDLDGAAVRISLGALTLETDAPEDGISTPPERALGTVHWPEEYGDPEIYTTWGDPAETDRRINIVIVPDGYTYAQKSLLYTHAESLVSYFRGKSPFREHDPFHNYTLVYAYSNNDGTDQCDCGILRDTAMNTRFPNNVSPCGDPGNRCLYYGWGCDPFNWTDANITAAELRAPARDVTLVMVNTTRYGGCGGGRAVFSAGVASAADIAIHELGHSLAGLADEYESNYSCGTSAGEINTSLDYVDGAWPEWIEDLKAPKLGGEYYSQCIYRPDWNCEMRALNSQFCPVCRQRWGLITYGHWRVAPSAPIDAASPASPVVAAAGEPVEFSVATRLSAAPATNTITWQAQGPNDPAPMTVATGVTSLTREFAPAGRHTLTCEVVGDANIVKPAKTDANRDVVSWVIHASAIPEVSAGVGRLLTLTRRPDGRVDLRFEDLGAEAYNIYVSSQPNTHPFAVASAGSGKRDCAVAGVAPAGGGMLVVEDYDLDAGIAGPTALLFVLVTADNGPASEGTLGVDSASVERDADARCAR